MVQAECKWGDRGCRGQLYPPSQLRPGRTLWMSVPRVGCCTLAHAGNRGCGQDMGLLKGQWTELEVDLEAEEEDRSSQN